MVLISILRLKRLSILFGISSFLKHTYSHMSALLNPDKYIMLVTYHMQYIKFFEKHSCIIIQKFSPPPPPPSPPAMAAMMAKLQQKQW